MDKRVCVYCSSSSVLEDGYVQSARDFGKEIALRGYTLVYGGAHVGLMGEVSKTAKAHGARVIGVIPEHFQAHGLAYDEADELVVTENMHERKATMASLADAFVALPGGFGTLEELLEMITFKQIGYHSKPIAIMNGNSFYSALLQQFEKLFDERFAKSHARALYCVVKEASEAFDYFESYKEEDAQKKWW